jgi:hypothetical protein
MSIFIYGDDDDDNFIWQCLRDVSRFHGPESKINLRAFLFKPHAHPYIFHASKRIELSDVF